ncbi:MAG: EVE domain-containing protein [Gammaproteobacteria bacterium]
MNYWLMKSEPSVYGIEDLRRDRRTSWGGVRNYQVRNMFRDQFAKGDLAFFYHSSCGEPGIVGAMGIVGPAYPDPTQFDPESEYFDPKVRRDAPAWLAVDVRYQQQFAAPLSLEALRLHPALADMLVLRRGNRLSVTPVTGAEAHVLLEMATGDAAR